MRHIADILIERGVLTKDQLQLALTAQAQSGKLLGRILVETGVVSEADLVSALACQVGVEFVTLADYPPSPELLSLIPYPLAARHNAVAIELRQDLLVVATGDPANLAVRDELASASGHEVRLVVATRSDIEHGLTRYASHSHVSRDQLAQAQRAEQAATEASRLPGPANSNHQAESMSESIIAAVTALLESLGATNLTAERIGGHTRITGSAFTAGQPTKVTVTVRASIPSTEDL